MKSREGLGREVRERVPSLTSPPPSLLFFRAPLLRTAPHYLNAWNRLGTRQLRWFNQHNQGSLVVKTMQAYQAIHDIVKSLINKGILVSLAYSNQEIKTRLQPGS